MRLLIPAAVMLVYACGASTPEPASAPTPALDSGSRVEDPRSEEHTSELQSRLHLVCRLLLEKKKKKNTQNKHKVVHTMQQKYIALHHSSSHTHYTPPNTLFKLQYVDNYTCYHIRRYVELHS